MRKNKIKLIVILPKFVFSGAGNSVFSFINYLNIKKFDISVICLGKCEYKRLFNKNIKYYELKKKSLFLAFFKIFSIIQNIKKNFSKTIIYSNHHYANIYAIIIKLILKNIKVVCIERTCIYELSKYYSLLDYIKKNIIKYLVKILYKRADKLISNTKYTKKEIRNFSKKNIFHVYPPSLTKIKKYKTKKIKNIINLLWVGRLSREKGCDDLIKSIKFLNFKANIFVLGDGIEYFEMKKLIKNKQNNNVKIFLKKYVKSPEPYFSKSHVLINTSYFEGSNNAITEAINNNLLILASDVPGGNKELLKNQRFGLFYEKNNPNNLAIKLNKIVENYSQLHSKLKLKKKFLKNFTNNFSNQKTLKYINRL